MSDLNPTPMRRIVPRTEIRPMPTWTWVAMGGIIVGLAVLGAIFLQVSRTTTVPNLVGKDQMEIAAIVKAAGLKLGAVKQVETSQAPAGQVISQSPAAGSSVQKGSTVTVTIAIAVVAAAVPDVRGLDATSAVTAVQQAGFTATQASVYSTAAVGIVVGQIPAPGVRLSIGDPVTVVVSGGTVAKTASVPSVVGQTADAATETLRAAGLTLKTIAGYSETVATGTVIAQSPAAGASARIGSVVAAIVSKGKGTGSATIPGVTGSSQASAEDAIRARGLTPVVDLQSSTRAAGTAISQFPSANATAAAGAEVLIVVAKAASDLVSVPALTGLSQSQAEAQLASLGLTARMVSSVSGAYPVGSISDQVPAAGTKVAPGSDVVVGIVTVAPQ